MIGVAVSSLFYHYLGKLNAYYDDVGTSGRFGRTFGVLAWTHLILMNAGVTATAAMLMLAGYQGGAAMLPATVGGQGLNAGQAHEIIGQYVEPIAASILVLMAGVIAGGVAFLIAYRHKIKFVVKSDKKNTEAT